MFDYLGGTLIINTLANGAAFKQESFDAGRVEKRASLNSVMFGTDQAMFIQTWLRNALLVDEVALFQLGQSDDVAYSKPAFDVPAPSSISNWPTKTKQGQYKIQGLWIENSPMFTTYERSTYNVLEWFGDVGGLLEALKLIGSFIALPFATFALKAKLLFLVFGQIESAPARSKTWKPDHSTAETEFPLIKKPA